jgi:hypothetical protein
MDQFDLSVYPSSDYEWLRTSLHVIIIETGVAIDLFPEEDEESSEIS